MAQLFFEKFDVLTRSTLTAILGQSEDCIKLVALDGTLEYMNLKGQGAMQIDRFEMVAGQQWTALWPEAAKGDILHSLAEARRGKAYRFEGFCPTAKGEERWWDVLVAPIFDDEGQPTRALATSRNITEQVRLRQAVSAELADAERNAEVQELSAREMRHRLKNLLAVIQAISSLVARNSADMDSFLWAFRKHLGSLATAQRLLTAPGAADHRLEAVIETALDAAGRDGRIEIGQVPTVLLSDDAVQVAALVFGELSTNAIKHGSLTCAEGKIRVEVVREDSGVRVLWIEDCGDDFEGKPLEGGSGLELIRRMTYLSGKQASFDMSQRGLTVSFWLPVRDPGTA